MDKKKKRKKTWKLLTRAHHQTKQCECFQANYLQNKNSIINVNKIAFYFYIYLTIVHFQSEDKTCTIEEFAVYYLNFIRNQTDE